MKKSKSKTVVIHTKKWCRGNWINTNGSCCALGFAGKQLYDNPLYFEGNALSN